MLVYHVSDTHGDVEPLVNVPDKADVILLTGDILPTFGRLIHTGRIDKETEVNYQTQWVDRHWATILKGFGDRPCLSVQGNHDFIGLPHVLELNMDTPARWVKDKLWAGFAGIPFLEGEWNHEYNSLRRPIEVALSYDPHILVTHAAGAYLSLAWGSPDIADAITRHTREWGSRRAPRLTHHFFGHIHERAGVVKDQGVSHINGACYGRLHYLED